MRRKNIVILVVSTIFLMMYFQEPVSVIADGANIVDNETRDRLIEQYRLDAPESTNSADWSHMDVGIKIGRASCRERVF